MAIPRAICLFALILFAFPVIAQNGAEQTETEKRGASLNFQNADINAVIEAVSEITGKNFIVDPRVKGNVTVITPRPFNEDAVYQMFLSTLDVLGYAAVPTGTAVKIVPEGRAKQLGSAPNKRPQNAGDIVTKIIPVENVPASTLVSILRPLMPQEAQLAAYPDGNMLIISDRKANVARIQSLIERLDTPETTNLEIVKLQYAQATNIVTALKEVSRATGDSAATEPLPIVAEPRTNSIIIGGDSKQKSALKSLIEKLDVDTTIEATTEVIYLQNADAETVAPLLQRFAQIQTQRNAAVAGATAGGAKTVGILPNPAINALVITAPAETIDAIRRVIKKIDIRRAQILVEAVIAEVSYNKSRELGIDLAAFGDNIAFASVLDTNTISALAGSSSLGDINPLSLAERGATFGAISSGSTTLAVLLKALASDSNTNILSAPTLVTMDNEKAKITVGQEVPFLTGSFSTPVSSGTDGGDGINPFQTIERKNVGLSLTIVPQISQGNTIRLDITQEISSISGTSANAVDIITNQRTLNTTVTVDSGKILVLGGLIDREVQESVTSIPLLSDIPILGELFKFRSAESRKRNLMIFIRPVIIRDPETSSYYTRLKYSGMRQAQMSSIQPGVLLMEGQLEPTLPPYGTVNGTMRPLLQPGSKTKARSLAKRQAPSLREYMDSIVPDDNRAPDWGRWALVGVVSRCIDNLIQIENPEVVPTQSSYEYCIRRVELP